MDDIVDQLRESLNNAAMFGVKDLIPIFEETLSEAVAEIERLRAEIERLTRYAVRYSADPRVLSQQYLIGDPEWVAEQGLGPMPDQEADRG